MWCDIHHHLPRRLSSCSRGNQVADDLRERGEAGQGENATWAASQGAARSLSPGNRPSPGATGGGAHPGGDGAKCLSDPRVCTNPHKALTARGHPLHLDLLSDGNGAVVASLKIALPLPPVKEFADFITDSCSLKG